jgi:anhydro-N-acetylmuramic acid kinase
LKRASLCIGLLSGTSMDGIDAGLFRIGTRRLETIATLFTPYPDDLRRELERVSRDPAQCTADVLGTLDRWVGECFRDAALALLEASGTGRDAVRAIGSHGQTLRHRPRAPRPFTLQIGDPNVIAAGTGIATVADFRRLDVALGGEGAPLAPAFHAWAMTDAAEARVVLNLGGIANVTVLPPGGGEVRGFDTGPANGLLDSWIRRHRGEPFDAGGHWAASGAVDAGFLGELLADPWFDAPPPKSTGFEHFNLGWVEAALARLSRSVPAADVQATLAELSAASIAAAIRRHAPGTQRVLACGGGVHNEDLLRRLRDALPGIPVGTTAEAGIDPDWVEAATFAWLALRRLEGLPGNLPSVTGAARPAVLGAVYAPG